MTNNNKEFWIDGRLSIVVIKLGSEPAYVRFEEDWPEWKTSDREAVMGQLSRAFDKCAELDKEDKA